MQKLKFEVIDLDNGGDFDLIGSIETTVGDVVGSRNSTFTGELKAKSGDKSMGKIIVRSECK